MKLKEGITLAALGLTSTGIVVGSINYAQKIEANYPNKPKLEACRLVDPAKERTPDHILYAQGSYKIPKIWNTTDFAGRPTTRDIPIYLVPSEIDEKDIVGYTKDFPEMTIYNPQIVIGGPAAVDGDRHNLIFQEDIDRNPEVVHINSEYILPYSRDAAMPLRRPRNMEFLLESPYHNFQDNSLWIQFPLPFKNNDKIIEQRVYMPARHLPEFEALVKNIKQIKNGKLLSGLPESGLYGTEDNCIQIGKTNFEDILPGYGEPGVQTKVEAILEELQKTK